jgi:hypothetical protein
MPAPWGTRSSSVSSIYKYAYRPQPDEQTMTTLSSHRAFLADTLNRQTARRNLIDSTFPYTAQPEIRGHIHPFNAEAGPGKRNIPNYIPEEETIRNDLTERYINTGEFGSNYIQGAAEGEICEEYVPLFNVANEKVSSFTEINGSQSRAR